MIEHIQNKIESLRFELKAIDYTENANNLTLHEYDDKRRLQIISKIQVLNEVIISFGIQK